MPRSNLKGFRTRLLDWTQEVEDVFTMHDFKTVDYLFKNILVILLYERVPNEETNNWIYVGQIIFHCDNTYVVGSEGTSIFKEIPCHILSTLHIEEDAPMHIKGGTYRNHGLGTCLLLLGILKTKELFPKVFAITLDDMTEKQCVGDSNIYSHVGFERIETSGPERILRIHHGSEFFHKATMIDLIGYIEGKISMAKEPKENDRKREREEESQTVQEEGDEEEADEGDDVGEEEEEEEEDASEEGSQAERFGRFLMLFLVVNSFTVMGVFLVFKIAFDPDPIDAGLNASQQFHHF